MQSTTSLKNSGTWPFRAPESLLSSDEIVSSFIRFVDGAIRRKRLGGKTVLVEEVSSAMMQIVQVQALSAYSSARPSRLARFARQRKNPTGRHLLARLSVTLHMLLSPPSVSDIARKERFYRALGAGRRVQPNPTSRDWASAREFILANPQVMAEKESLERLVVEGVWVGDLVYDEYLNAHSVRTIDPLDCRLRDHLTGFLADFFWWDRQISVGKIEAVFTSMVYRQGMVGRISSSKGIPTFLVLPHDLFRVAPNSPAYNPQQALRDVLDRSRESEIKAWEEERLKLDSKPNSVDAFNFHLKNPRGTKDRHRILPHPKDELSVLVALHDFSDSPHAMGIQLFPDLVEWLTFVIEVGTTTPYRWFVKPHPSSPSDDTIFLNELLRSAPNFRLLHGEVSNSQLFDEGLAAVITVHGSIAVESALHGIPVIACGRRTPYEDFDIAHMPSDKNDLGKLLRCLHGIQAKGSQAAASRYSALANFGNPPNKFLADYFSMMKRSSAEGQTIFYRSFLREYAQDPGLFASRVEKLKHFFEDTNALWFDSRDGRSIAETTKSGSSA